MPCRALKRNNKTFNSIFSYKTAFVDDVVVVVG